MREYFDYILLDTAAGMGAPFTAANRLADRALVVLTPDPVALRDGRIVADALLQSGRPASAVRLVMNRVSRSSFIYKNGDGNRPKGDYVNTVDEVAMKWA